MSRIPETTNLNEKLNESTPVFYGCLLLLLTLRFNAMINAIQQRTFSRLCCEVWSSQIVSQSWNIKFPSSTHHVLIPEAGEGTNARGEIQAICYSLCKILKIFSLSICFAIFCTPCQKRMFAFAATDADATKDATATLMYEVVTIMPWHLHPSLSPKEQLTLEDVKLT